MEGVFELDLQRHHFVVYIRDGVSVWKTEGVFLVDMCVHNVLRVWVWLRDYVSEWELSEKCKDPVQVN